MKTIAVIGLRGLPGIQGGVEKHCENMYPLMDGVKLRVYRRKPYLTELSQEQYPNIEFIDLPSTRIKGFEAVFHTFLCILHNLLNRPDCVHIHNIGPGMFAPILRLAGIKSVLTYHSANYEHKKWGYIARNILKFSEFLALKASNRVIFVNRFQMEKYSDSVKSKSCFIPNGITRIKASNSTSYIDLLGVTPGKYVLSVGRLTPEKGFEYLVEAVNKLPEVEHLVIAGAADHDEKYFEQLKRLDVNGKVIFTGYTFGENLCQLYSHAALYVLSSVNEGFPLVLLEAMNYGLPIVATDIPASHLIELDSYAYVKRADSSSLAEGIKKRLASGIAKPVAYDLSAYDWAAIAKRTQDVLTSL